ncbi:FRG1-like family-domain-containing protein [Mycena amicta]|nr:FRG1-like family-domain-containing protein [Mycena amicta]
MADTTKNRRDSSSKERNSSGSGSTTMSRDPRKVRKEDEREDEDWAPTFIYHPSDPLPCTPTYNATTGRLVVSNLTDSDEPILARTPTDVSQVWVLTRGTKFLASDAHGLISADRDARGPQEEWTPVVLPDGMVAFMNVYEKVAGGAVVLRGDSDEVGFRERFWVKIQHKYKKEAHEEEKQKTAVDPATVDEASSNKMFQTWGMGRSVVSESDKKELKRAKKEGRLAEAMLDRRAKLKSDRFC